MPFVKQLNVTSFRNLHSASFEPCLGINIIQGENGSGKTSLLEALSVLAHGRSFRTHKYRRLINHDSTEFTLFALLNGSGDGDPPCKLGINRSGRGSVAIKIDGKSVYSAAELAQRLPLLVMNSSSFQLLEGSSRFRRHFFDWLVFHVKHEFKEYWKNYARCVKHRNSLLRRGKISPAEIAPWDAELARLATKIDTLRAEVFVLLEAEFNRFLGAFSCAEDGKLQLCYEDLKLSYHSGWKAPGENYQDQLSENFERDVKLGYTSIGSHKADIKITLGKVDAVEVLSRGQQKSLIVSLFLAEATVFFGCTGRKPVFLLDDLPAELDGSNLSIVGKALTALNAQVFVTAIRAEAILDNWQYIDSGELKMFHVEHGVLSVST